MADPEHYEETYNTSTLLESIAIINSSEFKDFTINTDKVYNIRFKVNANIGAKLNEVSFAHIFNFKHSVLISFESMIGNKECKIFWKLSNCEKFYYLELSQSCNDVGAEFCKRFLMDEIKKGKSGILGNSQSKEIIEIHDIGNENNQNLLILAAMENNVEAVEILLKLGLDVEHGDSEDLFAIEKSWIIYSSAKDNRIREKSDQIILKLLKANSPLPTDYVGFDYDKASKNVQAFIDMCEDLHEDVQDGNIESLKKKIQENQGLYYFYNRDCYSIMDCACELGSPEIVKLLVSFGINPGCYGNIEKVYDKMDFKNRKILRKQHECSAKQMPKVHLYILKQKSKIGGNDWKHDKRWKYIEDAFEILDRNESCSKVLKVVATWNNLQIIFDFKQDTVYYLDPTKSESVRGAIYKTGKIYIGAQNLMIPEKKYKVIGVIIHELCHFAILLTFMNNFDPYPMGESEVKRRFVEIVVKECRDKSESEAMVSNVYSSYEESHQHSELIVIEVQVLMFYYINPTKIEELKNIYGELFKYFKEVVEPELERAVEMLKTLQNTENDIKYDNLLESMKTKILHSKLKFQEEEVSFFELIGNDHEILNLLSPKKLRGIILKDEEIKFGTTCANFVKYRIIERKFKNENNPLKYFSYSKWRNIHVSDEFNQVMELTNITKMFILSDTAGSGKTTTFINFAKKLKKQYNNYWIVYIKLRLHHNIFEEYEKNKINMSLNNVLDIILKILHLQNKLEIKIFSKLFNQNRAILLFDGIDEISPKFNQMIIEIIYTLKQKTQNQLWISTRPQHAKQLEEKFKVSIYNFEPYSDDDINDFIMEILKVLMPGKVDEQIKTKELLEKFLKTVGNNSFSSHYNVSNPLMIEIITELHVSGKINLQLDNLNLYKVFKQIVDKQKEIIDDKVKYEDRSLYMAFPIDKVHQILAIKFILKDNKYSKNIENLSILKSWEKQKLKWCAENIQRFGFVTVDLNNINSVDFTHRTYAEFFLTELIVSHIFDDTLDLPKNEVEIVFKLFIKILDKKLHFGFIFALLHSFVQDAAANNSLKLPDTTLELVKREIPIIRKKMYFILQQNQNSNFCMNFCKIILLKKDTFDVIKDDNPMSFIRNLELWISILKNAQLNKKLWHVSKKENLLMKILRSDVLNSFETFELILKILESSFGQSWYEIFNRRRNQISSTEEIEPYKLSCFSKNLIKVLNLIKINYNSKSMKFAHSNLLHNCMIFEHIEQSIQSKIFHDISEVFRQNQKDFLQFLILSVDSNSLNILKYIGDNIEDLLNENKDNIKTFLFHKFYKNNPLMKALMSNRVDIFKRYKELYIKYASSKTEIQNIFVNHCDLCYLFFTMNDEIYLELKSFIIETFTDKKEIIFHFPEYHEIKFDSFRKAFTFFEDFASSYFENDLANIKILAHKVFRFSYSHSLHPLIESAKIESLEEFIVCKDYFLKYENTIEELQQIFIKYCYLPKFILCVRSKIFPEFKKLIKEVFASKEELITKCLEDKVEFHSFTRKNVYTDKIEILIYDDHENEIRSITRVIMYNAINYFGEYFWIKNEMLSNYKKLKLFVELILDLFVNNEKLGWIIIRQSIFETHTIWDYLFLKGINKNYWIKIETITNSQKLELFEEISLCYCEGDIEESRNFIRKTLFYDKNSDYHPFYRAMKLNDIHKFRRIIEFYIKYKNSWEELQNIFISFCDLTSIFSEITGEIFLIFKSFLKETFNSNPNKIFECIDKKSWIYYHPRKTMKMFENFENFSSEFFINDKAMFKEFMRQIVFHKYWINYHPLIQSALSKNINDEFLYYKDLCLKHMNSKKEIQDYFIKSNYIPHVLLQAEPEVYSHFMHFIEEIFDSDIQKTRWWKFFLTRLFDGLGPL